MVCAHTRAVSWVHTRFTTYSRCGWTRSLHTVTCRYVGSPHAFALHWVCRLVARIQRALTLRSRFTHTGSYRYSSAGLLIRSGFAHRAVPFVFGLPLFVPPVCVVARAFAFAFTLPVNALRLIYFALFRFASFSSVFAGFAFTFTRVWFTLFTTYAVVGLVHCRAFRFGYLRGLRFYVPARHSRAVVRSGLCGYVCVPFTQVWLRVCGLRFTLLVTVRALPHGCRVHYVCLLPGLRLVPFVTLHARLPFVR